MCEYDAPRKPAKPMYSTSPLLLYLKKNQLTDSFTQKKKRNATQEVCNHTNDSLGSSSCLNLIYVFYSTSYKAKIIVAE